MMIILLNQLLLCAKLTYYYTLHFFLTAGFTTGGFLFCSNIKRLFSLFWIGYLLTYSLVVGETLAHYFIHHDSTGNRDIEGVDVAKLGDCD